MAGLTAATLLSELAYTRIASIAYFPHVAFLILSTALLGTGAAAAWQSRRPIGDDRPADEHTGMLMAGGGLTFLIAHVIVQRLKAEPLAVASSTFEVARLGVAFIVLAVPFCFSGAAVSRLLSAREGEGFRMYAADLFGAGVGCALAVPAMNVVGPRGALMLGAAAALAASALLLPRPRAWVVSGLAAVFTLSSPWADSLLPQYISEAKTTSRGQPFGPILAGPLTISTVESAHPRIDEVRFSREVHRLLFDAGLAAVRVPVRPTKSAHDATLPYELRPDAPTLIIGAGAGWEVAEALHFGRGPVDAVEIHPHVAGFAPRELQRSPRVTWHLEDGRTFLERVPRGTYGSIVMIHTISNAASASGALNLSESYLMTLEAAQALVRVLADDGVLLVTRPVAQLPRFVATLVAATRSVEDRLFVWSEGAQSSGFYGGVLFSKQPFTPEERRRVEERLRTRGLLLLHGPELPAREPALAAGLGRGPRGADRQLLVPATDDRPFFNQRIAFSDLRPRDFARSFGSGGRARMALEDTPLAETSAVVVLLEVLVVGAFVVLLPFWASGPRRRREQGSAPAVLAHLAYYPALGIGFMLVEISLIQQLGLLSGVPTRTLAIVVGGILLGAGLGSAWAERATRPRRRLVAAALAVAAWAVLGAELVHAVLGAPLAVRLSFEFLVSFALGVALGQPFPLGLAQTRTFGARWAAWAFGLNAVASVGATVMALILATELGFFGVSVVAAGCYVVAAAAHARLAV